MGGGGGVCVSMGGGGFHIGYGRDYLKKCLKGTGMSVA